MGKRRVVVTGIGVMSPNGVGRRAFLESLLAGRSGIRRIRTFDPSPFACQIAGEVEFNGRAFSKKEERNLPRVTRLAVRASEEVFEDAGLEPPALTDRERARFGVLVGSGGGSAEFAERHYRAYYGKRADPVSLYAVSGSTAGGLSSELSIRFGLRGPSHVITTGCTSSTDALGYAFREIQSGRLDRALAGGADAPIAEGILQGFHLMKILASRWNDAPEKGSRPFARDRGGFVLAEGSWMFLLEEMKLARARGAAVYGEILGYGSSCEAFHAVRLDADGAGGLQAIQTALGEAGLDADAVDHVNLHGTATVANDRLETQVMKQCFGKRAHHIPMNSTKSMTGHPQGASGAAGLAATLLTLREGKVHPTVNLDEPDPECDLDYVAGAARASGIEHALCNTLGFGSKCSALVVRRGPS